MKQLKNIFFSSKTTFALLLIFTISIGAATFIEEYYDTLTSKLAVYNARWFELLLLLMVINFIGHIKEYEMLKKKKWTGLTFHLAFILMIIGAGITRYVGFDGTMMIREGSSSNIIYSSNPILSVSVSDAADELVEIPLLLTRSIKKSFDFDIKTPQGSSINISFKDFIKNAEEYVSDNVEGGKDIIEIYTGKKLAYIESGETLGFGSVNVSFSTKEPSYINIFEKSGQLLISSMSQILVSKLKEASVDTFPAGEDVKLLENYEYYSERVSFVFKKIHRNAKFMLKSSDNNYADALILDVKKGKENHELRVFGGSGYIATPREYYVDGLKLNISYGDKPIELPFSIYLEDFILERYAGSVSPSSYASEVVVIDEVNGVRMNHKIYMNNILDYGGYRFFQSSYDKDEKGTILSVNHDFWGTWVSYISYFLLGLGLFLTFLNKESRFYALRKGVKEIRAKRKAGIFTVALLIGFSSLSFSQNSVKHISAEHADEFGRLIVQTFDGRFEPVHTMSIDVARKIAKKDRFELEDGSKIEATHMLLDMMLNSDYWKSKKIIYVGNKTLQDLLGIKGKRASFYDFFDQNSQYKLKSFSETAFRKPKEQQNKLDREIVKIDERVNVFMMVLEGSLLKIYPVPDSENNKWVSWDDKASFAPLTGPIEIINDDLQLKKFSFSSIFEAYLKEAILAKNSNHYNKTNKILSYIHQVQRQSSSADILPSETKINFEVHYNNWNIFVKLKLYYGVLCVFLLIFAFIDNLRSKKNKMIRVGLNIFIGLLALSFALHTYGMILRWYLSDHAPWSNGYEALLLAAWGGLFAGFMFVRSSKITLAATSLIAFFILMIAGFSNYDPQLTNLVPVLKSYWLIIHVASMTISYGFLGLSFVLGLMVMFIYLFKTKENSGRLNLLIKELTHINELNISIGLALAVIGCFLGGVWANESWGRYWGWDAKETWALVIIMTYTIILHFRLVPFLKGTYIFNVASIFGFASVLMTFIGVNYYLSKGMHSYASGDTPIFPLWVSGLIIFIISVIIVVGIKQYKMKEKE